MILYILKDLHIKETDDKRVKYIGYGIGNSHKEGAQQAAKMALIINGVLKEDQYSQSDIYYPNWDKIDRGLTDILSNNDNNDNNDINYDLKQDNNYDLKQDINYDLKQDNNYDLKQDNDNNSITSEKSI